MSDWLVGVRFLASGNLSNELASAGRAAERANLTFARSQGLIDKNTLAAQRYKLQMQAINQQHLQFKAMVLGGALAGGFELFKNGIEQAGKFQTAMTSVGLSVVATKQQLTDLSDIVQNLSNTTGQSAVTIAQEMQAAAQNGLNDPKQLKQLFPKMAKFADVIWLNSGQKIDPVHAIEQMSQLTHLLGAYRGPAMEQMLDTVAKAKLNSSESLDKFITQAGYFAKIAGASGLTNPQILQQLVAMSQVGLLRGKGGTGLANMLLALTDPTKSQYKGQIDGGLRDRSGKLLFEDAKGHIQFEKMNAYLANMVQHSKNSSETNALLFQMFGKQGGRFAATMESQASYEQIQRIKSQMGKQAGVEGQFQTLQQTYDYQKAHDLRVLQNINMDIWKTVLPEVTTGLGHLGNALVVIDDWIRSHPNFVKHGAESFLIGMGVVTVSLISTLWKLQRSVNIVADEILLSAGKGGGGSLLGGGKGGKRVFIGRGGKLLSVGEGVAEGAALRATEGVAVRGAAVGAGAALEEAGVAADATGIGLPVGLLLNLAGGALMIAPFIPDIVNGVKTVAKRASTNAVTGHKDGLTATGLNYGYQTVPDHSQDYLKHDAGWFIHQSGNKQAIALWDKLARQQQARDEHAKRIAEQQGEAFSHHWHQVQAQQQKQEAHLNAIRQSVDRLNATFAALNINVHIDKDGKATVTMDGLHQSLNNGAIPSVRTQGAIQTSPTTPLPGISPFLLNTFNQ